ncbi:TPA: LacI family DNA-binding transcriptional regulator [Bacillus anthracis]|uniref:LacI family DNA-binding transcriptional regulator n=1 Tax=Bacillus anthracis TaxID=1392 RepID=UPI0001DBFA88|nr:LacI family DNA-binding transcriptional regulator [Bacillus cereus]HDR4491464.1 LacI family DNA-binding transcriptional regulator [Bacillus cereus biovar anthracis]ADK06674.1 ribose operon repressor [Bacillus cereus biovar anthracis str. CI]HDR6225493.1 LacI family DNA-binding transcriptional regulator [Bacillus cereus biovar anthracis]HDR6231844.1 LacI family DNA-binding transcriptional regulator [Bacillus cereus biovar anthracis]HDR6236529.1 LacI family DNA-binding transcriptional regulat
MATIRDVAKLAGVSVATVSRVMNEKGYVHEDTVKQVKEAIEELHYRPNSAAKPLFKENSTIIALLVDNLYNPSNITLLHCIEEIAYKEGYQIIVCNIENKDRSIHMLKENNVAGVILTRSVFKSIGEISLPFVVIDEKKSHVNYYESGQIAVSLLKEKGCHFLAYFDEGENSEEMENHISGFLDAVWEGGISYREVFVQGYTNKQFITLLRNNPYIDGIVTGSDKVTFELIQAAKHLNIRIPDKLKIIGLNGSIDSEWIGPSFMKIESCIEENGEIALQQLKEKIKK